MLSSHFQQLRRVLAMGVYHATSFFPFLAGYIYTCTTPAPEAWQPQLQPQLHWQPHPTFLQQVWGWG
jgi:hypothetical protein